MKSLINFAILIFLIYYPTYSQFVENEKRVFFNDLIFESDSTYLFRLDNYDDTYIIPWSRRNDKIITEANIFNYIQKSDFHNIHRDIYSLGFATYEDKPVDIVWTGAPILYKGFTEFCFNGYNDFSNFCLSCYNTCSDCYNFRRGCKVTSVKPMTTEELHAEYSPLFYKFSLIINIPQSTSEYGMQWKSLKSYSASYHNNIISGTYTNYKGKLKLIIPPKLEHFHKTGGNIQSPLKFLSTNEIKVCADGSESSVFKIKTTDFDLRRVSASIIPLSSDTLISGRLRISQHTSDSLIIHYRHPSWIPENRSEVKMTLSVSISGLVINEIPITIYRSPVLMVHGLWSGSETFAKMESALNTPDLYPSTPKFFRRADYSTTNSHSFSINVPKIKSEINLLINSLSNAGIAAGNVDYIGHSMGGILGRLYLQGDSFEYGFHKLITLNTPHSGSQVADFLKKFSENYTQTADILCNHIIPLTLITNASGRACADGAIDNLRVNSPEITGTLNGLHRNFRTAPSHTITTIEYQTVKEIWETFSGENEIIQPGHSLIPKPKKIEKVLGATNTAKDVIMLADIGGHLVFDIATDLLFNGLNDKVVSLVSQKGGMTGNCTTVIENQAHTGSPENDNVISKVKKLLAETPKSNSFCLYFNPENLAQSIPPLITPNGSININLPTTGQNLLPGTSGTLSANGTNLTEITTLVEYNTHEIVVTKSTGNNITCTIPISQELGSKRVIVIGKTATGGYVVNTSHFNVSNTNYNLCSSLKSGSWNDVSIWSCGHMPTLIDDVIINSGHSIRITANMGPIQCKKLEVKSGAIFENSGNFFQAKP